MDLVRALSLGGIRSTVVAEPGDPACYSRAAVAVLEAIDAVGQQDRLLESLLSFARQQEEPPVLFYDNDWDLLFVSRHREELAAGFRFVVAHADLVEALVDKRRFQTLAAELSLPVPAARIMTASGEVPGATELRYPVIAKPFTRHPETWGTFTAAKALLFENEDGLRALQKTLVRTDLELLVQEYVPGGEERIESYHVYVDEAGEIVGEFTGRKIRTFPVNYGFSTALVTTMSDDVRALGRELVRRLGLRGVAKFDFKRGPDNRLYLFEVNPRFNLWHHLGAVAGMNLPALVYADLKGRARPTMSEVRAGVRWVHLAHDPKSARALGISPAHWLTWALTCEAKSGFAWDDPFPLPRAALARVRHRLPAALRGIHTHAAALPSDF